MTVLLHALAKQTLMDFEVVVVVDGSHDRTQHVVTSFSNQFKSLICFVQENSGRSATRNKGAALATGDLLIFYDDDTIPEPDSVARHYAFHVKHERCILMGVAPLWKQCINTDFIRYRAWANALWMDKRPKGIVKLDRSNFYLILTCFSMQNYLYTALGGFNNSLKSSEDMDFGIRAFNAGIA